MRGCLLKPVLLELRPVFVFELNDEPNGLEEPEELEEEPKVFRLN